MTGVVVTTKMFKAPVKMSPPTNQLPAFYRPGCPSCLQLYRCKKSIVVMYTSCVKCVTDIMVQSIHSCTIHHIHTLQVLAYVLCYEFLIVNCLLVRSKGAAMSHCSG